MIVYINKTSLLIGFIFLFLLSACTTTRKRPSQDDLLSKQVDSLILSEQAHSFNGIILIKKENRILYSKAKGYADLGNKDMINLNHQFVIGSISKQITAVLILQAYEKKLLNLEQPISQYLPKLPLDWKDSVSVHHLLIHKHGIQALDKPLAFSPNSQFQYSQLGYELLAQILEQVCKRSFVDIATALFQKHGLTQTFHPQNKQFKNLVKGYTENDKGKLVYEIHSFENYVPAGGFISTAQDLAKWNTLLYKGKLLKRHTFELATTKHATRQHPIFDTIDYGYGLTFKANEQDFEIGALGFAPGFVSSNFYFPKSKLSVIVLENTATNLHDFRQTFYYHTNIIELVRIIEK